MSEAANFILSLSLFYTVAHKYHGKAFFLTAKLSFSRQNSLSHGKTFFLTAKLSFSRQNSLFHGKTFFSLQNSFSRQNFLFHGKTFFLMANRSFVEYNICSEEKLVQKAKRMNDTWLMREIQRPPFAKHFPPWDHPDSTYA